MTTFLKKQWETHSGSIIVGIIVSAFTIGGLLFSFDDHVADQKMHLNENENNQLHRVDDFLEQIKVQKTEVAEAKKDVTANALEINTTKGDIKAIQKAQDLMLVAIQGQGKTLDDIRNILLSNQ
jgi:uncharacterized protein (DUF3084 family)